MNTPAQSATLLQIPVAPVRTGLRLEPLIPATEKTLDFLTAVFAVSVANAVCQVCKSLQPADGQPAPVLLGAVVFAILLVLHLDRSGAYGASMSLLGVRETERILGATLQTFSYAYVATYFLALRISRSTLALALLTTPLLLAVEKYETHKLLCRLREKGNTGKRALILGTGKSGRRIYSALARSPKFGVNPVAFVDVDPGQDAPEIRELAYTRKSPVRVVPGPIRSELFRQMNISVLVIAKGQMEQSALSHTKAIAWQSGVEVYFLPDDLIEPTEQVKYANLDGIVLGFVEPELPSRFREIGKRLQDIVGALLLTAVFSPLLIYTALRVKLSSRGPIFFRQQRVGKGGQLFTMWKFRTMFCDAPEYSHSPKESGDPRITPVGRSLRRYGLDEFPQLLNVLRGDMSLVGPRPEMPFIAAEYSQLQERRLSVKSGMTGIWQMSVDRSNPIHENLEYDFYYIQHRGFLIDLAILLHTPFFAARGV